MALRGIEDLKPCGRNPRAISGEALAGLKVSLAQFGDIGGLVWNRRSGELVAGHQRLRALKTLYGDKLALETGGNPGGEAGENPAETHAWLVAPTGERWPVRVVDWDEMTHLGAMVTANNGAITGENTDELQGILAELEEHDGDLFRGLRLDELLDDAGVADEGVDPDEVPDEFPDPVTGLGDVWLLGDHRLVCGDSTGPDVSRLMDGARAAMAFTDPPYNVAYEGKAGTIANDDLGAGFEAFLEKALRNLLAFTDGACYVCMSSSELDTLQAAWRSAGGHWSTFLIWAKDTFTMGRSDYQRQYEPILYGWRRGASHHWCGDRDQGDVWHCDRPRVSKLHPTTKPVELIVRAINNSSVAGDLVLDLFGGSGSTLIACECSGRRARLMELDPRFTAASSQRLAGSAVATLGATGALIVVYTPRTDHQGTLLSKSSGTAHNLSHLAGNATIRFSTNTSSLDMSVTAPAVGTRRLLIAQGNASGRELWVNNVAGGTSAASFGGFTVDDFGMYRATAGFFSNSDVEHVILCSQMMDATARAKLQAWFNVVAP